MRRNILGNGKLRTDSRLGNTKTMADWEEAAVLESRWQSRVPAGPSPGRASS